MARLFAYLWRAVNCWPEPERYVGLALLLVAVGAWYYEEGPTHG